MQAKKVMIMYPNVPVNQEIVILFVLKLLCAVVLPKMHLCRDRALHLRIMSPELPNKFRICASTINTQNFTGHISVGFERCKETLKLMGHRH